MRITACPLEIVPDEAWAVIDAAELWEKGIPPTAGGSEQQAASFVEAMRFVAAERARWEAKLSPRPAGRRGR